MAHRPSNIERNEWTLDLLNLKPTDRLLEVGFGPGIAIERASRIITRGLIVGVDHSVTMMQQASKRNAAAIEREVVKLYFGTIETFQKRGIFISARGRKANVTRVCRICVGY